MKLYAIMKKTGSKTWKSAFPVKKGVTRARAESVLRKNIKKGNTFKIITEKQLNAYMKKLSSRTTTTRKRKARRVVRRKVRRYRRK